MIGEALDAEGGEARADLLRYVRRLAEKWDLSESEVDAEGVVQHAYEQMFLSHDSIENRSAWLRTVARRRVARIVGDRKRHRDGGNLEYVERYAGDVRWASLAPRPDLDFVMAWWMAMSAIKGLPRKQKIATCLSLGGWSHAEIAERLGCATSTVAVHVHRGTRALAAVLLPVPQDHETEESKRASHRSVAVPIFVGIGGSSGGGGVYTHWHTLVPILVGILTGILAISLVVGLWKCISRKIVKRPAIDDRTSAVSATGRAGLG